MKTHGRLWVGLVAVDRGSWHSWSCRPSPHSRWRFCQRAWPTILDGVGGSSGLIPRFSRVSTIPNAIALALHRFFADWVLFMV